MFESGRFTQVECSSLKKREFVALLIMYSSLYVSVIVFVLEPLSHGAWVGLWSVFVAFPGHT